MNLENQQPGFNPIEEDSSDIVSMEELLGLTNTSTEEEEDDEPIDIDSEVEKALTLDEEEEEEEIKIPSAESEENSEDEVEIDEAESKVNYKSVIKAVWGDEIESILEQGDNGEEIEILLDDANVDEEMFINILKSKIEEIEDTYKSRVSTEEVSDFTRHLINIEKNGGSTKQAIELYNTYQDPLNALNLDNERDQIKALIMRYRAGGMEDEQIQDLIDAHTTKGVLKERAETAKGELEEAVKARLDAMEAKSAEDKVKREEAIKQYRKNLKDTISTFNVKDTIKNKIVDMSTKRGQDQQFDIDKMYNEIRLDHQRFAELALYMLDREAFIKQVSQKAVIDEKKSTMKKLSLIPTKQRKTTTNNKSSDSNEVTLDELLNN